MRSIATAAALALVGAASGGCDIKSFIDPSEMFVDTKKPIQNPILDSISDIYPSIDDPTEQFVNAGDIRPEDSQVVERDYKISKGDLLTVSVPDLNGTGTEAVKQSRVSETGNITMPLIGQVHADGLTEEGLQTAIANAYINGKYLNSPQISVTVIEQRSRTFSALGAVGNAGEYTILRSNFRMLDALVQIRDITPTVQYAYVVRQISEDPSSIKAAKPDDKSGTPSVPAPPSGRPSRNGGDVLNPRTDATPIGTPIVAPKTAPKLNKVVYLQTSGTPTGGSTGGGFAFNAPSGSADTRVIRVPLGPLRQGDFRYNIVIRPHDLIIAPLPVQGEYYLGGHISRAGVYSLADRKITLMQAVIAAGMLDGVAIPERTELIRRVGPNRQAMVRLDLNAIFSGTQPDLYLKPYDQVMVGTNIIAPFISDLRNGFRITYGFGFLYDRNYAPINSQ